MKKTIYGCTLLIIGTMFLLCNLALYIPLYIIGIIMLIFDAISGSNKDMKETADENDETTLIYLRDIEVLSNEELEDAIKLFSGQTLKNKENEEYSKCLTMVNKLKQKGYFNDDTLREKIVQLKSYYDMN